VGIDIGHFAIKVAVVEHTARGHVLLGAGMTRFDQPHIQDGDIREGSYEVVMNTLASLIQSALPDGMQGEIVSGINWAQGVIGDRVIVKVEKDQDPEELILLDASNRSPFDEQDISLDYEILNHDTSRNEYEVLLLAAKNRILNRWADFFKEAGLPLVAMDVDAIAAVNTLIATKSAGELRDSVVGVMNIGWRKAHLSMVRNGKYHSTREVQNASVEFFESTIARYLGMDREKAGQLLRGEYEGEFDENMFHDGLNQASEELSVGIDLALQYYRSVEKQEMVDKIFLVGGGANLQGVAQVLSERLNDIDVEALDPVSRIPYDEDRLGGAITPELSNMLAVAIGRALRKF